jgi:hypothetical protein
VVLSPGEDDVVVIGFLEGGGEEIEEEKFD